MPKIIICFLWYSSCLLHTPFNNPISTTYPISILSTQPSANFRSRPFPKTDKAMKTGCRNDCPNRSNSRESLVSYTFSVHYFWARDINTTHSTWAISANCATPYFEYVLAAAFDVASIKNNSGTFL